MIVVVLLAILALTVSGLLSYFLITPLMFYILDSVLYLNVKILKSSWAVEAFTLYDNRYNRTIQGKNRVYIPNPLRYILYNFKNIKKFERNKITDRESDIFGKNILNMPINPIVKNADCSLFKFTHIKSIIKRLTTKCK